MHGYAGRILRVDLTGGVVSKEPLQEEVVFQWIGGTGIGTYYLLNEVPPGETWSSPENRIVLASGPLGGTRVHGSGNFSVVTKGAMTGGATSSQANGKFGAFIKFCGYDALIVQGIADNLVYLHIRSDGNAVLEDATFLKGKNTREVWQILTKKIGKPVSVFGTGPAGENLVKFAALVGDDGHVAAHNGVGAVMGAKKLKAIVVERGMTKISTCNPKRVVELTKEMCERAKQGIYKDVATWGTAEVYSTYHSFGGLPVKNLTTNVFPEHSDFSGRKIRTEFQTKPKPCWACNWNHLHSVKIVEGPHAGFEGEEPEYEALVATGSLIGQKDLASAVVLSNLVDWLGMDVNETGWMLAWLIECYEEGMISSADLDGLELKWGNVEPIKVLLQKIATREGIGDILADGIKVAAEKFSHEVRAVAVFTEKGNSPRGHDHRAIWPELLDTCVSGTGTIEATGGSFKVQEHGLEPMTNQFDYQQVAKQNAITSGRRIFQDCLGACRFTTDHFPLLIETLNSVTGWHFSVDDAMMVGKRIINALRIYNIRCGHGAGMESPSPRYASLVKDGPASGANPSLVWPEMKSLYYELMGWNKETGEPLPGTLYALGLEKM